MFEYILLEIFKSVMPTRVVWYRRYTDIVHLYSKILPETLEIIRTNLHLEDLVDTNSLKYNPRRFQGLRTSNLLLTTLTLCDLTDHFEFVLPWIEICAYIVLFYVYFQKILIRI